MTRAFSTWFTGSVGLALGALLLPVSAGAGPTGAAPAAAAAGRLRVEVVGARIPVEITITGPKGAVPDGYHKVVTGDRILRALTPGSYWIEPSPFVTPERKPAVTVSRRQFEVRAGMTAKVTVSYSALRPVRRVAAGQFATCAALQSGRVRCWGGGFLEGEADQSWPMTVVKGVSDVRDVAVSSRGVCALRRSGVVKCWGERYLGNGTRRSSAHPVRVSRLDDAVAIAAGSRHVCALRDNGRVRCWGANDSGQLGDGSKRDASAPVRVERVTAATAVSAGWRHSCALLADGTARCWGENRRGQLGNGTEIDSSVPVKVGRLGRATEIAAGGEHACAVLRDGTVKCWGTDENGQLGSAFPYLDGDDLWSTFPRTVKIIDSAVSVTASGVHTCARLRGGALMCWGGNSFGQLGIGSITQGADRPVPVMRIDDATAVSAGELYTCAARAGGKVSCWGSGGAGQLGNGAEKAQEPVPQRVLGFGR